MRAAQKRPFAVIDGETIHRAIFDDLDGCLDMVRSAYLAYEEGRAINPRSVFLTFPQKPRDRIIALPAHLGAPWGVSGIKWIASYPENVQRGLPRASAVLILNDEENGYPFACLEGSVISASRTAASAALAAHHLFSEQHRVRVLGIIGTGLIAGYIYKFLTGMGWQFDTVLLHDESSATAQRFRDDLCAKNRHDVRIAADASSLLAAADLTIFATTAATPHIHDPALLAHRPVILHISLRDLSPRLLLESWNVVDDVEHVMNAKTSPHLAEELLGSRAFVTATLADVVRGRWSADHSRPIIFSPFGLGLLDLAVGKWVYERVVATGRHRSIDNFFSGLEP